ncbi:hypothetical protein HQ529_03010 [Candidatus Woesearchaeota archaeon]|nr:hypothetical protein [Candidatus Woesearchaeota archaeon]
MGMYKITIFSIVVLFFLSGCEIGTQDTVMDSDVHTGTQGLIISTISGSPPKEILHRSPFQIGLELRNKGATNINNGYVLVKYIGKGKDYFNILDENTKAFSLEGKSVLNLGGGYDILLFNVENTAVSKEEEPGYFFGIIGCYDYKTSASVEVCLNPVSAETAKIGLDVCSTDDLVLGSQGAPIAVKKIKEYILPKQESGKSIVYFNVYLQNVGGGSIALLENYTDVCRGKGKTINLEDVKISAKIKNEEMSCEKVGKDKENPEQVIFICSTALEILESHTTILNIEAKYGYITKEIGVTMKVNKIAGDFCEYVCIKEEWGVCDVYGEGTEGKCPDGMKCCTESTSLCERDHQNDGYGCYDECAEGTLDKDKCPGDLKCCKELYVGGCEDEENPNKGNCVNTYGTSCNPFGGVRDGTCDEGLRCCAQSNPLCMTEEELGDSGVNYADEVDNYYCVLESEIGNNKPYTCANTTSSKCPGMGDNSKICCYIESKNN